MEHPRRGHPAGADRPGRASPADCLPPSPPVPGPPSPLALGLALEAAGDPGAGRAFRAAWDALGRSDPTTLGVSLGGYRPEELVHLLADKIAPHR
ncbi:hypothetical protein [Conexibacter sp. DBS9H8]|uniref:hypothetical protein n=1 Tax=Conexibacter sp. DBS9H8 TaxID=2937801 RepID=UPI00201002C7|nr:hypothetical protein [Conexibacter sp. DBS9H8]